MTPLERAARALFDSWHDWKLTDLKGGLEAAWNAASEEDRQMHMRDARAALTAIREPSEVVDTALVKFAGDMRFTRSDGSTFGVSELFRAGIDAMLAEGE